MTETSFLVSSSAVFRYVNVIDTALHACGTQHQDDNFCQAFASGNACSLQYSFEVITVQRVELCSTVDRTGSF